MTAGPSGPDGDTTADRARHWRRMRRLTGVLLVLWFVITFVVAWFARELDFELFGWPFSFWVAAQGALVVYCVLIVVHARLSNRLDSEHGRSD